MRKYEWTSTRFEADAQVVGEELERIELEGTLERDNVLDYARKNEDSELHKCFEWDDTIAGEKYRKYQATNILQSISIITKGLDEKEEIVKAYVNITIADENKRKYKNISRVLDDEEEYKQLIEKAYKDFLRTKEKYEKVVELEDLKEIIFDLYRGIK